MKTYTQKVELLKEQIILGLKKKINAKATFDIEFGYFGVKLPTDVFNEVVIDDVLMEYIAIIGLNVYAICKDGYKNYLGNLPLDELARIADLL